jgi:hypothetical protein
MYNYIFFSYPIFQEIRTAYKFLGRGLDRRFLRRLTLDERIILK